MPVQGALLEGGHVIEASAYVIAGIVVWGGFFWLMLDKSKGGSK